MTHPKIGKLGIQKKKCATKNLGNQKQTFCLSAVNETLVRDGDLRSTKKLAESGDASIAKLTSSSLARRNNGSRTFFANRATSSRTRHHLHSTIA